MDILYIPQLDEASGKETGRELRAIGFFAACPKRTEFLSPTSQ